MHLGARLPVRKQGIKDQAIAETTRKKGCALIYKVDGTCENKLLLTTAAAAARRPPR